MLNHIVLMGRLTKDPELRHTQSGKACTSFSVACTRDYDKDKTDFIDCVAFGNTAEFVSKYFAKGRMIAIDGRFYVRDWTDNNDNKHKRVEVVCNAVYFADSKKADEQTDNGKWEEIDLPSGELPF